MLQHADVAKALRDQDSKKFIFLIGMFILTISMFTLMILFTIVINILQDCMD